MRVLGADVLDGRPPDDGPLTRVGLDELLERSDVVSLHATLDEHSRDLIGERALAAMKPSAVLVNTARGGLVDTGALLAALDAGAVAGAALDVLDVEPAAPDVREALARHPRVVLSPHAAWYSEESFVQLKTEVAREALRAVRGEPPRSPVNRPAASAVRS
jgi:D-3-phosphoglycerate dehydrogenase